jgi:hypothetical protein
LKMHDILARPTIEGVNWFRDGTKALFFHYHFKSLVSGLLFNCPFDRGNPETCPIHDIREILQNNKDEKSWRRIHDFLQSLNEEQSRKLYRYHHLCLSNKEN